MTVMWPAVDDHAVEPETGKEMIKGEIQDVRPAEPPHGDGQGMVAAVLSGNVAAGYVCAIELLTRFASDFDFAADVSIRRKGIDPDTGSRYLEELVFEVKYEQSLEDLTRRARVMAARGVRRIFIIFASDDPAANGPVVEWSVREDRWVELDKEGEIEDSCLVRPVRVRGLLDRTEALDEMACGVVAQGNPSVMRNEQKKLEEQVRKHQAVLREQLAVLCNVLDIEITAERRAEMESMDSERLRRLFEAIGAQRRWPLELDQKCEIGRQREVRWQDDGLDDLYASFSIEMTPGRRAAMKAMGDE
jgi:hypothetical protein